MRNHLLVLAAAMAATVASTDLQALVMEVNFSGEVSSVTNRVGEFWDADAIVGSAIEGRMRLDTDHVRGGREEYPGIWWVDMDYLASAISSSISIGGVPFDILQEPVDEPDTSAEFINLQARMTLEGEQVDALMHLSDSQQRNGSHTRLQLYLTDPVQAFVPFHEGSDDFDWSAFELPFHLGQSSGEFRHSLWQPDGVGTLFDTRVQFFLNDVFVHQVDDAEPVPEPSTTAFLLLGLFGLGMHRFRHFLTRGSRS